MLTIPLAAVPSQTLSVVLAGQACKIALYTQLGNLYFNLIVNGSAVVTTRICRNIQRLLLNAQYYGFIGDFMFIDSQGDTDPQYTGLGARYQFQYLEASDL